MMTGSRSRVHILIVLTKMKNAEREAEKVLKTRVDKVVYIHDGATIYNAFTWLNVEHKRVKFRERDYAEQGFRSLKHRIS